VLAKTARLLRDIRGASAYGIQVGAPHLLWPQTLARVKQVIADVQSNKDVPEQIRAAGGELFLEGSATFISPHEIRLADSERVLRGEQIILCVGGHSRRLPIPGIEHALYPEDILELEKLPRSVAIVGSGYTGVQLVTVMNAFGAEVTLLEMLPNVLPSADHAIGEVLRTSFERQGATVVTGIKGVERIERDGDTRRLVYARDDQQHTIECEAVFVCAGWPAAVEGLGLEQAGVEVERGFITTNRYLQTNVPHIYVAGDANGQGMLVQGAHFEAHVAAENAVRGPSQAFEHALLPNGGFTDPDHAGVGLTEEQARQQKLNVATAIAHYADLDRAIIDNQTVGLLKLIVDRDSELVIGAHAAGENAVEVIQAVATAMAADAKVSTLAGVELAYPTYTAIIGAAARQFEPEIGHAAMSANTRFRQVNRQGERD
jgi:glutathione reductase (NADPH)